MKIIASFLAVAVIASSVTFATAVLVPGQAEAASKSFCRDYAYRKARKKAGVGKVLTGTAIGAGLGAGIGAIFGGKRSIVKGAVLGGVGGTVVGGVNANEKYRRVYDEQYRYCREEL